MPQTVPNHVLELYKSGNMPTADMDEFEALVESGELVLPSQTPAEKNIVPEADINRIQSMLGDSPPPVTTQDSNGFQPTTGMPQEEVVEPDISQISSLGKGEIPEWVDNVNGVPTIREDIFNAYQTRSLDHNTRLRVEEAIKSGDYTLPIGKTLNVPTPQSEKPLMTRLSDFWSGADRRGGADYKTFLESKGAYSGITKGGDRWFGEGEDSTAPEAIGRFLFGSTAGTEERAKMAESTGHRVDRDFYNNPVLTSPEGEKSMIEPGVGAADLVGATAMAAPSMAIAPVVGAATAGYGLLAGIGAMGMTEVAIESAIQTGQKMYGGDFDALDVAIAGGLSVVGDLASAGLSAYGKREIQKTVKDAINGDKKALAKYKKMYADGDEAIDVITESVNKKYNPFNETFENSKGFKESLKEMAQDPSNIETHKQLADVMPVDKESIEAAEHLGVQDKMTLSEIADLSDTETREFVDSISEEGLKSIVGQKSTRKKPLDAVFIKKMEDMKATDDIGKLSKSIKTVMTKDIEKTKQKARVMYEDLKPATKGATAEATETISSLQKLAKDWEIRVKEGEILVDKDASNPFTAIEKQIKSALSKKTAETPASTLLDPTTLKPLVEASSREVVPPMVRLNTLRKKVGSMIKDMNITNYEQYKSLDLNKMLRRDEDRAMQALAKKKGDQSIYDNWVESDKLWREAKDKDNAMIELFSEKLDKNMFRDVGSVTDEMFNSGIEKLEKMLKSVPKDRRSEVINTALIKAMGRSEDLMKEGGFGKWYAGFKNNSRGMKLLKDNMTADEFKTFTSMGKLNMKIREGMDKLKDTSIAKVKDVVGAKNSLVQDMAENMLGYLVAGGVVGTVAQMAPSGIATTALSLTTLGAVRGFQRHISAKQFDSFIDVLNSKDFLNLLASKNNGKVFIKNLSKSEKMKRFAKLMKIGSTPSDIEQYIKASMKSGARVDRIEDDKDLQTTQP